METEKTISVQGFLMVFSAGILWGFVGLFIKELEYAGSTPELTGLLRVFFAFSVMGAACCVKYGIAGLRVDRRTLLVCVLLGVICHGIYNIFYSLAVTLSGVSVSAVLLNTAPVFTLCFSAVLFGERFTMVKIIAIAMNIVGCVFTATNGHFDIRTLSVAGILCGIGSGMTYALTAIFGRLATGKTNSIVMSMYSYLSASIFLFLWMRPWQGTVHFNMEILIWGFLYALIPTAIAYGLYYQGLQSIAESSKVPVISSVEAVIAAIIGVLLYHERLSVFGFVGIVLVLSSIAVMNVTPKAKRSRIHHLNYK